MPFVERLNKAYEFKDNSVKKIVKAKDAKKQDAKAGDKVFIGLYGASE